MLLLETSSFIIIWLEKVFCDISTKFGEKKLKFLISLGQYFWKTSILKIKCIQTVKKHFDISVDGETKHPNFLAINSAVKEISWKIGKVCSILNCLFSGFNSSSCKTYNAK